MPPELIEFQRAFAATLDQPASGAMAVYRNTVLHGAVEALRANYPVVEQIIGSEMFDQVAVDFASTCPPRSPILANYGREFGDWLLHQRWIDDLPYLADVAKVERLHLACLLAADCEPLPPERVRRIFPLHNGVLRLHPSVRFGWFSTPAMSIWQAHQRRLAATIEPEWKAEGALFVRPEPFVVHAPRIGAAAHRILSGLRLGETVSASIAAARRLYPKEDARAVFESLINLGLFAAPSQGRKS